MKKNVRSFHVKARKLLRLYSEWQETRRSDIQRQCLSLLGELQNIEPQFSLRREFRNAF